MQKITGEEFRDVLLNVDKDILFNVDNDYIISNYIVEVEYDLEITLDINYIVLYFKNITFTGNLITFRTKGKDILISLEFQNCTFLCNVKFNNCIFNYFIFSSNLIKSKSFLIRKCKINELCFKVNNTFESGKLVSKEVNIFENVNFEILNCEFDSYFDLEEISFNSSNFNIENTVFNCLASIVRCNIHQLKFSFCFYKEHFNYFGNKTNPNYSSSTFNHCEFNYSSFFETNFNFETNFSNCKFLNVTKFENIGNDIRTTLKFEDCEFVNQVSFDKTRIHKLFFHNVSFNNIVSLQETYFDIVDINRTIFEKQAYFDDIQIKQIDKCDRKTIRAIKLQLQKAENKIDYNRFRVFEFNAYRKDLKKDGNKLRVIGDRVILWISKFVSNYGNNWIRAFCFTLFFGLFFYLLFYLAENYDQSIDVLSYDNWSRFISGFFRFFLVTDFFNPLANDRTYLTNPLSWLFFIFGKIVISFGLYEMVQSFRKFKA
jgi:hypothetical protein